MPTSSMRNFSVFFFPSPMLFYSLHYKSFYPALLPFHIPNSVCEELFLAYFTSSQTFLSVMLFEVKVHETITSLGKHEPFGRKRS